MLPATLPTGYRPEMDILEELNVRGANQFQELIGILRWMVKLSWIEIAMPVALLSSFLALPRWGHQEVAYHIFASLKLHDWSKIVFDYAKIDWDSGKFKHVDWSDFYLDAATYMPPNVPEVQGQSVQINCFMDAGHAGAIRWHDGHTRSYWSIWKVHQLIGIPRDKTWLRVPLLGVNS